MRLIVVIAVLLSARAFAQPAANQEIQALETTVQQQEAANDRTGQEKTLRKLCRRSARRIG